MSDEETIRADLKAAHASAMRYFGDVATAETEAKYPPLAALDRLVAERDALLAREARVRALVEKWTFEPGHPLESIVNDCARELEAALSDDQPSEDA